MTAQDSELNYYERATCSKQWLEFNKGLAAELSAGLPPEEVRLLFRRIGERVAAAMPIARCDTVDALRDSFNLHWDAIGWGFASLHEQDGQLRITHACSPIAAAFGPGTSDWAGGFFEGAYQNWFEAQGIPSELRVRADGAEGSEPRRVVLRLGRFDESAR